MQMILGMKSTNFICLPCHSVLEIFEPLADSSPVNVVHRQESARMDLNNHSLPSVTTRGSVPGIGSKSGPLQVAPPVVEAIPVDMIDEPLEVCFWALHLFFLSGFLLIAPPSDGDWHLSLDGCSHTAAERIVVLSHTIA